MGEHLSWRGKACGKKHAGPDDGMKLQDVLPDHMHISGPKALKGVIASQAPDARKIIEERIKPHIDDPRLALHWNGNAPGELTTCDAKISKTLTYDVFDFGSPAWRLNKIRVFVLNISK
jgi:hypothetical protein